VLFVGTPDGLESRLVPQAGLTFSALPARGFDRSRPWSLVTSSALIAVSTVRAVSLLRRWRPDVVLGFGGYVSIPVGFAAWLTRTPLVLHEQNSVPGLANRVLARRAAAIGITYPSSGTFLGGDSATVVTGNPVRSAVLGAQRVDGRTALGLPLDALVLLVFGGSRGARHINSALVGLRQRLLSVDGLFIVHVTGPAEHDAVERALAKAGGDADRWRVLDYLDDMGGAIAAADVVVARAGATSIAEITALGTPCVLVPYPYATDDHQTTNAQAVVEAGAGVAVSDAELDEPRFGDVVLDLLSDAPARASMSAASRALGRPDAARRLADLARAHAVVRESRAHATDARS